MQLVSSLAMLFLFLFLLDADPMFVVLVAAQFNLFVFVRDYLLLCVALDCHWTVTGLECQVPATPDEALRTSLMGIFEKRRFRNFLQYLAGYEEDQPDTFKGTERVE